MQLLYLLTFLFASLNINSMYKAALKGQLQALTIGNGPEALTCQLSPTFETPKTSAEQMHAKAVNELVAILPQECSDHIEPLKQQSSPIFRITQFCMANRIPLPPKQMQKVEDLLIASMHKDTKSKRNGGAAALELHFLSGTGLLQLNTHLHPIHFLNEAINSRNCDANFQMGLNCLMEGDDEKASKYLQIALEEKSAPAAHLLIYIWRKHSTAEDVRLQIQDKELQKFIDDLAAREARFLRSMELHSKSSTETPATLLEQQSPLALFQEALRLEIGLVCKPDLNQSRLYLSQAAAYYHLPARMFFAIQLICNGMLQEACSILNSTLECRPDGQVYTPENVALQFGELMESLEESSALANLVLARMCSPDEQIESFKENYVGHLKRAIALSKGKDGEYAEIRAAATQLLRHAALQDFEVLKEVVCDRLGLSEYPTLEVNMHEVGCLIKSAIEAGKLNPEQLEELSQILEAAVNKYATIQNGQTNYRNVDIQLLVRAGEAELLLLKKKRELITNRKQKPNIGTCRAWPWLIEAANRDLTSEKDLAASKSAINFLVTTIFLESIEIEAHIEPLSKMAWLCNWLQFEEDQNLRNQVVKKQKKEVLAKPYIATALIARNENLELAIELTVQIIEAIEAESQSEYLFALYLSKLSDAMQKLANRLQKGDKLYCPANGLVAYLIKFFSGEESKSKIRSHATIAGKDPFALLARGLINYPQTVPTGKDLELVKQSADAGCVIAQNVLMQIYSPQNNIICALDCIEKYKKNITSRSKSAFALQALDSSTKNPGLKVELEKRGYTQAKLIEMLEENVSSASEIIMKKAAEIYRYGFPLGLPSEQQLIKKDPSKAVEILKFGTKKNFKQTQLTLADMEYVGEGTAIDKASAKQRLLKAALASTSPLKDCPAIMYHLDRQYQKNVVLEEKWPDSDIKDLNDLANAGYLAAQCMLGSIKLSTPKVLGLEPSSGADINNDTADLVGAIKNGGSSHGKFANDICERYILLEFESAHIAASAEPKANSLFNILKKALDEVGTIIDFTDKK